MPSSRTPVFKACSPCRAPTLVAQQGSTKDLLTEGAGCRLGLRRRYRQLQTSFHKKVVAGTEPWVHTRTPDDSGTLRSKLTHACLRFLRVTSLLVRLDR